MGGSASSARGVGRVQLDWAARCSWGETPGGERWRGGWIYGCTPEASRFVLALAGGGGPPFWLMTLRPDNAAPFFASRGYGCMVSTFQVSHSDIGACLTFNSLLPSTKTLTTTRIAATAPYAPFAIRATVKATAAHVVAVVPVRAYKGTLTPTIIVNHCYNSIHSTLGLAFHLICQLTLRHPLSSQPLDLSTTLHGSPLIMFPPRPTPFPSRDIAPIPTPLAASGSSPRRRATRRVTPGSQSQE